MLELPSGAIWFPEFLDKQAQVQLIEEIREIVRQAPLYIPQMPNTGTPMRVRMTNCGTLGWVTDKENGYRYQSTHPQTGNAWPKIPKQILDIWNKLSEFNQEPEACLINFYDNQAKMGMHQDKDEKNLEAPVISISLGDECLFRIGGQTRGGKTDSFRLRSGDVIILKGQSRLAFHGVDKIYPDTSTLLKNGGRINLTLRRVN